MIMKKLFLFATVVAAGLFASCSSSDDSLREAGNPAFGNVDDGDAIKIGIGNLSGMATRGTGTVGDVASGTDNNWYGQYINVFMFNHGTFDLALEDPADENSAKLYDDRKMVTPGSEENLIVDGLFTGSNPAASGEAMNADATIKYYPPNGVYDFFGYHIDDAKVGDIDRTGTEKWTIPFEIDGTQDLMSTQAVITPDQIDIDGVGAAYSDFYSAKAARKGIQPTLTFNHLLSRLQFRLFAGNAETAGYGKGYVIATYSIRNISAQEFGNLAQTDQDLFEFANGNDATEGYKAILSPVDAATYDGYSDAVKALGTAATFANGYDADRAVKVEEIQVLSKSKGKMLVSWKASQCDNNYMMGTLDAAAYTGAHDQSKWTANGTTPETYSWVGGVVDDDAWSHFSDGEKAVAHSYNAMPAYKKISWDETQEGEHGATNKPDWKWLSLKQRAKWQMRGDALPPVDADVEGYTDAKDAIAESNGYNPLDNTTWHTLKDKLEGATAELTTAQEELTQATQDLTEAKGNLEVKKNDLEQKEQDKTQKKNALADALTAKNAAHAALDAADPNDPDYTNLQQAASDADDDYANAQNLYNQAEQAVNTAKAAVTAAETDVAAKTTAKQNKQIAYNQKKAAYNTALSNYNNGVALEEQLSPSLIMTQTISDEVYAKLSASGKAKYEQVTNAKNTNLSPLTPTAAEIQDVDYSASPISYNHKPATGTPIGDALLIAPNKYDANGVATGEGLKMKVKISQKVPINWNYPRRYEYKSQTYTLDIPVPTKGVLNDANNPLTNSAFMINNSYTVNLTIYGFSRIDVQTVINRWNDGGDIAVGEA